MSIRFFLHASLLLLGVTLQGAANAQSLLIVRLTGFDSVSGVARIAVFDSPEFWPEDVEFSVRRISAAFTADTVVMTVRNLVPGTYAISAFHDEDSDSVFDRGLFGVPTENYGFSNGARGSMGPPDFEEAVFTVGADTLVMEVRLE